jgi:predicted ATPase
MKKVIISGGPCSGKTTLFEALTDAYPEAYFIPEPAERVISRELGKKAIDPTYNPVLTTTRYADFLPLVVAESEQLEDEVPKDAELVILDRSLIDNIGYARHYNHKVDLKRLENLVTAANYTLSLFLEPLDYANSVIRLENPLDASWLARYLRATYQTYMTDKDVHDVPAYPLQSRVDYARFIIGLNLPV